MCPPRGLDSNDPANTDLWRPWEGENISPKLIKLSKTTLLSQVAPNTNPPLTCNMCTSSFKRESELKRHKSSKHSMKREECKFCLKIFTRKDNLTRHVKLAHGGDTKPFCKHCNKPLSRKDAVQRHESTCTKNPNKARPTPVQPCPVPSPPPKLEILLPARLRLKGKNWESSKN